MEPNRTQQRNKNSNTLHYWNKVAVVCLIVLCIYQLVFLSYIHKYIITTAPPSPVKNSKNLDSPNSLQSTANHNFTTYKINTDTYSLTMSSEREEEAAKKPNLSQVLSKDRESFIDFLGSIYEHSAWVAEELYDGKLPDDTNNIQKISDLFERMKTIVDSSSQARKLELLRAHPDLCERVQTLKTLTKASQEEQSRAGLQFLTEEEKTDFLKANTTYKEKFGFPFILAVRNASKYTVLSAIQARVKTDSIETEMNAAVGQVHKIAWMRLLSAIETPEPKGFLTCHVLDTASGTPAANMRIHLYRINPTDNSRIFLNEFITNSDGRLSSGPALKGKDFVAGVYYEWIFFVGDYFAQLPHLKTSGTPFLNEVPIRFGMDDPDEHYHVPLLVSPFGFSTYRGS